MSFMNPQPQRHVPDVSQDAPLLQPGDPLGSFVGYLRRPKSSAAGLVAQFFGENGDDADVISALHLTRFLDSHVKVTVWMLKDRSGKITKKDGSPIKLTEFIGVIRRPQPSNTGQVAQFFGENGPNADAINVLNQSLYLDALVYVEMQQALAGMTPLDVPTAAPVEALEHHANRLTPTEVQELKKMQKRSQEALKFLTLSGFFRQEQVLRSLGREEDFHAWLGGQVCCHPGQTPCDISPVHAYGVAGTRSYGFIPLCDTHRDLWEAGDVTLVDGSSPVSFAQAQSITFAQRWATHALHQQLRVPPGSIPTPGAIYAWATDKKLAGYIPNTFKAFLASV